MTEVSLAALPPGLATVQITGQWLTLDGQPGRGTVTLRPVPDRLVAPTLDLVITGALRVPLDEQGQITVTVPATDDAALLPQPWHYRVRVDVAGVCRYEVELAAPAGTVDLADHTPSGPVPDPGRTYVYSVNGMTGHVTVDGGGGGSAVTSVNGQTGAVVLGAGDVGADPAGSAAAAEAAAVTYAEGLTAADVGAVPTTQVGQPDGVASLDAAGLVPAEQLPPATGGTVTSVAGVAPDAGGDVPLTAPDVGALPDTYTPPVTSVNGATGDVLLGAAEVGADPAGAAADAQAAAIAHADALTAADVGALPDTYTPPVTSVNGATGAVVLDAAEVGADPAGAAADAQAAAIAYADGLTAADLGAVPTAQVGQPDGVASLNADGQVPAAQLPPPEDSSRLRLEDLEWPLLVAHRGAMAVAPENTAAAFAAAIAAGAQVIELDACLGADGSLIINHDATLTRTHGVGLAVADMTAQSVTKYPVRSDSALGFTGWPDVPMLTLDDVFREFGGAPVVWFIEAKYPSGETAARLDALGDAIVDCVHRWGMEQSVMVQAFSQRPGLRAIAAGLPAGYIETAGATSPTDLYAAGFRFYGMRQDAPGANMAAAQAAGHRLLVYTVNRRSERDALPVVPDGIVTNQPWYLDDASPAATRDSYPAGAWPHGHLLLPSVPVAGEFTGGGLELAPPTLASGDPENYTSVVVGAFKVLPDTFTLTLDIEILEALNTTRSGQILLSENDEGYTDVDQNLRSYNLIVRPTGALDLYRSDAPGATLLGQATSPALTVDPDAPTRATVEISVTPTQLSFRRVDAASTPSSVTVTDTTFRGLVLGVGLRSARARFSNLRLT